MAQSSDNMRLADAKPKNGNGVRFNLPENNADWSDEYWRHFDMISDAEAKAFTTITKSESDRCLQHLSQTLLEPCTSLDQPILEHWRNSLARTLVIPGRLFNERIRIREEIDDRYHLELGLYSTVELQRHPNHLKLVGTAKGLCELLEARALALENAGGSLYKTLDEIARATRNWHHQTRQDHRTTQDDQDESDEIYVLNCPQLHVISKQGLVRYLGNVVPQSQESLQAGAAFIEWPSRNCPACGAGCVSARLIEPLRGIAQQAVDLERDRMTIRWNVAELLQYTLGLSQREQGLLSETATPTGSHRPSSSFGERSVRQVSITTASSHSDGFFEWSEALKYAFTASGVHLILWKQAYKCFATLGLYSSSDVYWDIPTGSSSNTFLVAGGNAVFCALVQDSSKKFTLHVFAQGQRTPRYSFEIDNSTVTQPFAMAVSPDDSSVAVGFGKAIVVCDLNAATCGETYDLTRDGVRDQVINFSRDSTRVVVASRMSFDGSVYCNTWEKSASPNSGKRVQIDKWKKGSSGDYGLRSVFYDDVNRCAIVAAYVSYLASESNTYLIGGYKTQCAAQSGDAFLFVSDDWTKRRHEVVELSTTNAASKGEVWLNVQGLRGHRTTFTKKEELPIMASVKADKTAMFWVSDGKMNLAWIQKQPPHESMPKNEHKQKQKQKQKHEHGQIHEHKVINERFSALRSQLVGI
ncbi:hypothetical protein Q7P37_008213 [Cladosporium fusiforme]